jgi:hypothetical protein
MSTTRIAPIEPPYEPEIESSLWYHLIGFVCTGAGVEFEDWAERFPAS